MIQAPTIESSEGGAEKSISLLAADHSRFMGEWPSSLNIHYQAGPETELITSTESILSRLPAHATEALAIQILMA